ncbi:MAG: hypothetical protein MI741_21970, partial [Rhodospirillales bacterium]|nr:hypothetical protein [Rhodospirillales bacterium]
MSEMRREPRRKGRPAYWPPNTWLPLAAAGLTAALFGWVTPQAAGEIVIHQAEIGMMLGEGVANEETKGILGFEPEKVSDEATDALADFDRYAKRGLWEKALRALEEATSTGTTGFVASGGGNIGRGGNRPFVWYTPLREHLRRELARMPAEGRDAYRLFNDPKAKMQFESAISDAELIESERISRVTQVLDQYFISSVGDNAANWLGDAAFEQGQFRQAAERWASILKYHPASEIPEAQLQVKRALALARAGDRQAYEEVAGVIRLRLADQPVDLGGRQLTAGEALAMVESTTGNSSSTGGGTTQQLPQRLELREGEPLWQAKFLLPSAQKKLDQFNRNNYRGLNLGNFAPPVHFD